MAQRRSRNRRLSARKSNVSGFLNEDTNVFENNDPLWYDRTAVRPSTSLRLSKNTTAVLDPDSTVHVSQLSEDWFENLSQSDSSRLLAEAVTNKASQRNEEPADSDHRSAVATESESEHEFQKKRSNFRSTRKHSSKIDKSNAFMKALENTTDSHTRNLTHVQLLEGNESESTHDDSRTIRKLRPKFNRRAKNDTNNFDKALESDSASERLDTSRRSLRSISKRISGVNEEFVVPEKQQRVTRSTSEKIADVSYGNKSFDKLQNKSVNKSRDKTITEFSVRELRNRTIESSTTKSVTPVPSTRKSSGTKKRPAEDQSFSSTSRSPEVKKHKRQLFSQGNKSVVEKSKTDKSAFDAALDSVNDSQGIKATITEANSTSNKSAQHKTQKNAGVEDDNNEDDDSDSSSIPQNIRRTRSRSLFGERKSGETGDVNSSKNKSKTREKNSSKNVSQASKDRSAVNESIASDGHNSVKNLTIAESSEGEEEMYNSRTESRTVEQATTNESQSAKRQISSVETDSDSEDMVDASPSKTKQSETNQSEKMESAKLQISSIEMSDDEDMINMSASRIEENKANSSKKSNESSGKANKSRPSKSTSSGDVNENASSPELSTSKSRSRLFQKKNTSKDDNVFDQISFNKSLSLRAKTMEKDIEETPRLSQRSPIIINKSQTNQSINVSKNKSNSRENSKNDSKADQSEDETSTIPKHIRRTRSRLFQKSKAIDDDNTFEDASDVNNVDSVPENRSELSQQKSRTLNKSTNKSASVIRDAVVNKSIPEQTKKKSKIKNDKVTRTSNSNKSVADSPMKYQEKRRSSPRKSAANSSLNKENTVRNSQDGVIDNRSIETSSDGTPAPVSPRESSTPFAHPVLSSNSALKRISVIPKSVKSIQESTFDDLLHTPDPAQSTLNPHGKPVNRISHFSFRTFPDLEERSPRTADEAVNPPLSAVPENHDDLDVTGVSDVSDYPLLSRHANDIPPDQESSQASNKTPVVSKSPKKNNQVLRNDNNEQTTPIDWDKAKQYTDTVKKMVEAQQRLADEQRKKRELEKKRIDAKVKRLQAQREAELKRKNKKPVDKAFLVDGKVYKQPKLPRPKSWVTHRFYRFLWKKMEPKFGISTRVKSEEFALQLSDFATRIVKLKKFGTYKKELDELIMTMAKLGIIKTRYDFYMFTIEFLPSYFREKVNPIAEPGTGQHIPYDLETLHKPLLNNSRSTQETVSDES